MVEQMGTAKTASDESSSAKRSEEAQTGVRRTTIETYGPAPDARPSRGFHSQIIRCTFMGDLWDDASRADHMKQLRDGVLAAKWMYVGGWIKVADNTWELYYYDDSGD